MREWRKTAAVLAGLLPGVGACGGATGPEWGTFTLAAVSVDGEPLPATLANWPDYHRELLGDTIRLRSGDRWDRVRVERLTGFSGVPDTTTWETEGRVVAMGVLLMLAPDCSPDASCLAGDVLVPVDGMYRIDEPVSPEIQVAVLYRRIGSD